MLIVFPNKGQIIFNENMVSRDNDPEVVTGGWVLLKPPYLECVYIFLFNIFVNYLYL